MVCSLWYRAHVCHHIVLCRNHYDSVERAATHGIHCILHPFRFAFIFSRLFQFHDAKSSEVVKFSSTVYFDCLAEMLLISSSLYDINIEEKHTHSAEYKQCYYTTHNCFIGLKFYVQLFYQFIGWPERSFFRPHIALKYMDGCAD